MTALSDAAIARLRSAAVWPEFSTDRYTVVEEIGRGGMGTVYLALDGELDRDVAVKVPNAAARAGLERRLHREARVLARLEHPGIIPIHDVGRLADGRLFYVMKRVRGRTLREHVSEPHDLPDRLRIFERLCEPVAFAHAHGIIHRDLKPDNVMIGAFGEVMVMDWGVAKYTEDTEGVTDDTDDTEDAEGTEGTEGTEDTEGTLPGTVVGTRGFMPPEQARGEADAVDRRADIYGLGAILFLLLTGDPPPADGDPAHAIWRRRDVPKPLRAICARALSADPAARYECVTDVADDVARYRAGGAVRAYQENAFERIARLARTYRAALLLIVGYLLMRIAVALTAGW